MTDQPATPRGFWASLFHATDPGADSLVVGGMVALVSLILLQALDTALGHGFNPINFGGAAGAIITAIGTGKWARDGRAPPS